MVSKVERGIPANARTDDARTSSSSDADRVFGRHRCGAVLRAGVPMVGACLTATYGYRSVVCAMQSNHYEDHADDEARD